MLSSNVIKTIRKEVKKEDDSLVRIFHALSDPGRFKMFKLLATQPELCVTDVAKIFNISLPAASVQLKILEMSGLVKRERMGQMICFFLNRNNHLVRSLVKLTNLNFSLRVKDLIWGRFQNV